MKDRKRVRERWSLLSCHWLRWHRLIDVQLTLEHLQTHLVLLIIQHKFNLHAWWQRQGRRCLVNCGALCPDFSFISCSTCLMMTLSATVCRHGNYAAFAQLTALMPGNIIYLLRDNFSTNMLPFSKDYAEDFCCKYSKDSTFEIRCRDLKWPLQLRNIFFHFKPPKYYWLI